MNKVIAILVVVGALEAVPKGFGMQKTLESRSGQRPSRTTPLQKVLLLKEYRFVHPGNISAPGGYQPDKSFCL